MRVNKNFVVNKNLSGNMDLVNALLHGETFELIEVDTDMFQILVDCGIFRSRSEARKNWKRTGRDIPNGFTDLQDIGKLHHRITIINLEKK